MWIPALILLDVRSILARFRTPIDILQTTEPVEDYALLVPIFGDLKYLQNVEFLSKHAQHVVLCTTDRESDEFMHGLREVAQAHGFRVRAVLSDSSATNPWQIYSTMLQAHEAVLLGTVDDLTEEYVVFLDADTVIEADPGHLCGLARNHDFDLSSVKILPTVERTMIQKLQGVEYDLAMQARLIYPWLTSGAGMVGRRIVMQRLLRNHSLFFNGGDIEIGRLANMLGYHVGHIPVIFRTDIPETVRGWVNQRTSWMCGCFRHSVVNFDCNLAHPFHMIYYGVFIYAMLPIKLLNIVLHLESMPLVLGIYALLSLFALGRKPRMWLVLFPVYALGQVTVVIWLGMARYFISAWRGRNIGRIRVRDGRRSPMTPKRARSVASAWAGMAAVWVVIGTLLQL